ncbi:MAG: hypothetical protein WCF59_04120 [Desulfobaccales bacterium]
MKKVRTFIQDMLIDSTSSLSGDFTITEDITVIHATMPNSMGRCPIMSLNNTIVLRRKKDLIVPYDIEKEIKDAENILANRGPQPGPPTSGESD